MRLPYEKKLFVVLLAGAVFTALAPVVAPEVMYYTEFLGVRMGSLVSVLIYLFPSIVCMGMVSPIIIELINKSKEEAGQSAGKVYAVSTVGGILATFLAGFYLIPEVGINKTSFITAGVLTLISAVFFLKKKESKPIMAAVIALLLISNMDRGVEKSDTFKVVHKSAGILGDWIVMDRGEGIKNDEIQVARRLLLNGIDQTYTQVGFEPLSLWKYPHKLTAYTSIKPKGANALLLGMGGGSIAFEMSAMGFDLDIVELDEQLEEIVTKYFKYDPSLSNLVFDDARHYMRTVDKKYDVVVMDLVIGEVQPSHVFSLEGFEDLKRIINEDALVVINFQGNLSDPVYSLGPKSIFKTLEASGFYVDYFSGNAKAGENNLTGDIFFLASLADLDYKNLFKNVRYNEWFPYENFYYKDLISEKKLDLSDAFVLCDDKPKLELINAGAILNWRKNKLKQNMRKMVEEGVAIY